MSSSSPRSHLRTLISQRDDLEQQLISLSSQDTTEPLVDAEGFPRADLDVHRIREIRAQRARLQTDHVALMKQIETSMYALHAANKKDPSKTTTTTIPKSNDIIQPRQEQKQPATTPSPIIPISTPTSTPSTRTSTSTPSITLSSHPPFYLVDQVFEDSPAQVAGLRIGDRILSFGSITRSNRTPTSMQQVVSSSIGRAIPVVIHRNPEGVLTLRLTPQTWPGKGLLGCHLTDI